MRSSENFRISKRPSQNAGSDVSSMASRREMLSKTLYCLIADRIPTGTPRRMTSTIVPAVRAMVEGMRCKNSVLMGVLEDQETPGSPVRRPPI